MKGRSLLNSLLPVVIACFLTVSAFGQGAPEQAAQAALDLFNAGQTKPAAEAFEKVLKDYPTSAVVSSSQFRLAYCYFLLSDFDKALSMIAKCSAPPAPAEVIELALALKPKITAGKASALALGDKARNTTFETAIKEFDDFIAKYPKSDEVEGARYGRALASFYIDKLDDAVAGLRQNLKEFAKSESILDSKYFLGVVLARQFQKASFGETPDPAAAQARATEAIATFDEIVNLKTDVSLANDAQFQLGDIYLIQAATADDAAKAALYTKALAAFRSVQSRDVMVKAQEARVAAVRARFPEAAGKITLLKQIQALLGREREKLEVLKTASDKTISAMIKVGQTFFSQGKYDEARVMMTTLEPFAKDDQQKDVLYYKALSYAMQGVADKAVGAYDAFQSKFKGDPMAENLPVAMGAMFAGSDPDKATVYLDEAVKLYPKTRLMPQILTSKAQTLLSQKKFDEALKTYQDFLKTNPAKELAMQAEVGVAAIYSQTGKLDDALTAFKSVRDKYGDQPQGEQAAFNVAGILLQKGSNKEAATEFAAFIAKFPSSKSVPQATYFLGVAQELSGDKDTAIATYKTVAEKYKDDPNAAEALFRSALVLNGQQKIDEMSVVLQSLVDKFPQSPRLFAAYDMIAQVLLSKGQTKEAIQQYLTLVEKNPTNPSAPEALLKAADLQRQNAQSMGRYLGMNEETRKVWEQNVKDSIEYATRMVKTFPDSPSVAQALKSLLEAYRLFVDAKLKTESDVESAFKALAAEFESKPALKAKILFTLAGYTYEKDKAKGLEQMTAAFDATVQFAPADLDRYGNALLEEGKTADAATVYEKLKNDYPNPVGTPHDKAPLVIQEAQSMAIFGEGKVMEKDGKTAEAAAKFDELKKLYPWSPKITEANYGIAAGLVEAGKMDDAQTLLVAVIRDQRAAGETRAKAMLLVARVAESKNNLDVAIDNYVKISAFLSTVTDPASEGLYKGAELLEKKAAAESDPAKKKALSDKAKSFFKQLREKYPDTDWAKKAQGK